MDRSPLVDLDPSAWLHPEDRRLLRIVRSLPYARRINDWALNDQAHSVPLPAFGPVEPLRTDSVQHAIYLDVLRVLDAPVRWPIFVLPCRSRNALVVGGPRPYVMVTLGLLASGDRETLRFALGHEVGHILAGHCEYTWILTRMARTGWAAAAIDPFLAGAAALALELALKRWYRASELSADRCGLLALQDPVAAQRSLAGLCCGPARGDIVQTLGSLFSTHPERRRRMRALAVWVRQGGYAQILSGHYPRASVSHDQPIVGEEADLLLRARADLQALGLYDADETPWQGDTTPDESLMDEAEAELSAAIEAAAREG